MSFNSVTYANDVLNEFNVKMTVIKSGTTCKILQYLAEPSKVLQKFCSRFRFLWNWANTVNLCAALKTESLFSLVFLNFLCSRILRHPGKKVPFPKKLFESCCRLRPVAKNAKFEIQLLWCHDVSLCPIVGPPHISSSFLWKSKYSRLPD